MRAFPQSSFQQLKCGRFRPLSRSLRFAAGIFSGCTNFPYRRDSCGGSFTRVPPFPSAQVPKGNPAQTETLYRVSDSKRIPLADGP